MSQNRTSTVMLGDKLRVSTVLLLPVRKHLADGRTFFAPGTVHARVPQGSWSRRFERRRNRHRPCDRRRYIETPLRCGCADRPYHKQDMFGRCRADRRQPAEHGSPTPYIRSVASPADMSKGRRLCESSCLCLATCLALIHSNPRSRWHRAGATAIA